MPSPVGHALAGAAIARASPTQRNLLICAAIAAVPDLDLLLPLTHRTVTHSVTAVAATFIIVAAVTGKVTRWKLAALYAAAYASHLLLDWLGVDRRPPFGIQMLWPFSHRWFISGADIFPQTIRSVSTLAGLVPNIHAVLVETLIMLPIVVILWVAWAPHAASTTRS